MQQEAKSFKPTVAEYEKQKYVPKWTKLHDYSNFTDKMRRGNLNTDENGMQLEEYFEMLHGDDRRGRGRERIGRT